MRLPVFRANRPAGAFGLGADFAVNGVGSRPVFLSKTGGGASEFHGLYFVALKLRLVIGVNAHVVKHKISVGRAAGALGGERRVRQHFQPNAGDHLKWCVKIHLVLGTVRVSAAHKQGTVRLSGEGHLVAHVCARGRKFHGVKFHRIVFLLGNLCAQLLFKLRKALS